MEFRVILVVFLPLFLSLSLSLSLFSAAPPLSFASIQSACRSSLSPPPLFSYIFVDVYRATMQHDTNHIISVSLARARDYVDKGTRTSVDFHGISNRYSSLFPSTLDLAHSSATSCQPGFNEKPFARDLAPRLSVAAIISQTDTTRPRVQPFPGQLIAG